MPKLELFLTDESVNMFCNKLQRIIDFHLFLSKLNKDNLRKDDAIKIVKTNITRIGSKKRVTAVFFPNHPVGIVVEANYPVIILGATPCRFKSGYPQYQ